MWVQKITSTAFLAERKSCPEDRVSDNLKITNDIDFLRVAIACHSAEGLPSAGTAVQWQLTTALSSKISPVKALNVC